MYILRYGGAWEETPVRRPELLTKLAPDHLQAHCAWNALWRCPLWDTTLYGYPRFRLAVVNSRFSLGGGHVVTIRDQNGNIKQTTPNEVLYPLYHVPEPFYGNYVLEMWRPAAWFYEQGFGGTAAVEYQGVSGVRQLEPIHPDGHWVGIMNGHRPLTFLRNVDAGMIRWGVYCAHLLWDHMEAEKKLRARQTVEQKIGVRMERQQAQLEQDKKEAEAELRLRRPTMPGPMVAIRTKEIHESSDTVRND